jgi:hypothetical protein
MPVILFKRTTTAAFWPGGISYRNKNNSVAATISAAMTTSAGRFIPPTCNRSREAARSETSNPLDARGQDDHGVRQTACTTGAMRRLARKRWLISRRRGKREWRDKPRMELRSSIRVGSVRPPLEAPRCTLTTKNWNQA